MLRSLRDTLEVELSANLEGIEKIVLTLQGPHSGSFTTDEWT